MGTHVREQESHIPSRRATLRAIGFSGLAAALPITAAALAAEPPSHAELVRLGAEFDRLHAAMLPAWWAWREAGKRCRDILDADGPLTLDGYKAARRDSGLDETGEVLEEAQHPLDAIVGRIRELPAGGLAGLAVKSRVVLYESFSPHQYDRVADADMDWDVFCYVRFMREIAALAGEARA